ncbi:immunoglobulin superfamily member 1-like [Scomber scombrus]
MNPAGEVNWGQNVSITCSISTQLLGGTFILKKTSGSLRDTQTSSTNSTTFNIHNVNFDNEGSYQCQYEKNISSHSFNSPLSDSFRLSVAVTFPKPSISMNPAGEVSWGQSISITCSISTQLLGGTFILKKTSGSFRDNQTSSTNSATFNIRNVNFDNEGSYQCQYEKIISSQSFSSPLSDSVRLSVNVTFPKPSIFMYPAGEVSWGQYVRITCSISTQHLGGTFILNKDSGSFRMTQSSSTNSSNFNIPNVNVDNEGSYQCQYEKRSPRQNFNSPLSDSVRLSVNVPLQQPNISLTSPNRGLVWGPEGARVTRGYSFVLTCSINSSHGEGRFLLIFSGSNITTKPAVNLSVSFNFPVAEYEYEGNYSCVYEVTLSRRDFCSPETAPITVTIKFPLLLLVSSVAAGSLLLFLLVLLVVCLVCMRRRQAKHPITIAMSPVAVSALNIYQGVEEVEEEGEDYRNIEAMCSQ